MKNKTCGECKHYNIAMFHCEKFDCYAGEKEHCEDFEPKKPTVFDRITSSPEVLAAKLTYWQYDPEQDRCGWTNNIIVGQLFKNYHEAIIATVEKLNGVEE